MKAAGSAFRNIAGAATTLVHTGGCILERVVMNKRVASGVVTIYDNTAASGTKVGTITNAGTLLSDEPITVDYGTACRTGLTVVTSAADDITVVYTPTL